MGTTLSSIAAPVGDVTVSRAQLDAEACIVCGDSGGLLIPAGYFYARDADGTRHPWAVVVCVKERRAKL